MAQKTYLLTVDGVGQFEVYRRTMLMQAKIGAEYNRLTEGQNEISDFFGRFCVVYATLKTLIAVSPASWDIDDLDPDDESAYEQMYKLFDAVIEKERFFRSGGQPDGQATGAGSRPKD